MVVVSGEAGVFNSSITLAEPVRKQVNLLLECSASRVVPDDVIGSNDFRRKVELCVYHPLDEIIRKARAPIERTLEIYARPD